MTLAPEIVRMRSIIGFIACIAAAAWLSAPANANILAPSRLAAIVDASPALQRSTLSGRPYVTVKHTADGGFLDGSIVDYGYLKNGQDVLMVPLPSGGSGGVFFTLLFTGVVKAPHFVGYLSSQGHLDVHLSAGIINVVRPTYGPNDPQCCPSSHTTVRYRLAGTKLVKLADPT